jgi:hypothetical protein
MSVDLPVVCMQWTSSWAIADSGISGVMATTATVLNPWLELASVACNGTGFHQIMDPGN